MDINNLQEVEKYRKAAKSKDGSLILNHIKQELNNTFDFSKIIIDRDNYAVGEDFKVYYRIKEALDNILEIFN